VDNLRETLREGCWQAVDKLWTACEQVSTETRPFMKAPTLHGRRRKQVSTETLPLVNDATTNALGNAE
jgi:hypothetical protein